MTDVLLHTKLFVPRSRPNLVSRPRLIRQLNRGILQGCNLTLISAPAGFGKTTLAREWLVSSGHPAAWISLDEGDNDPVRFFAYLTAALHQIIPAVEQISIGGPAGIGATEPHLASLVNHLAFAPHQVLLVLDDYHVIEETAVHDAVNFLVKNLPSQSHLVIVTRFDPPFNLARLRAHGHLAELRVDDLRFNSQEMVHYLNDQMNLSLDIADLKLLAARTEGWIAGLQLAALSMRDLSDKHTFVSTFAGEQRFVLEYLTEEVFSRQSEPVQEFLTHTSILGRMNSSLCNAVTGSDNGEEMLELLQRMNLFVIPLDDDRYWYRYHSLFADLLGNQLRHALSPSGIRELHRRASSWHTRHGSTDEAVAHSLKAQDYEQVIRLVEEGAPVTMSAGRVATLLRWLNALPAEHLQSSPRLQIHQGWALFLNGDSEHAERILLDSRRALTGQLSSPQTRALRGEVAALLATIASVHGDVSRIEKEAQEALALLPEEDVVSRGRAMRALGNAYGLTGETGRSIKSMQEASRLALEGGNIFMAGDIASVIGVTRIHQGRLRQAARAFERVISLAKQTEHAASPHPFSSLGHAGLATIHLEWNDLEQAKEHLDRSIFLSEKGGIGYNLIVNFTAEARLKNAYGAPKEALESLEKAGKTLEAFPSLPNAIHLISCQVQQWLLLGDVQSALKWAIEGPKALRLTARLDELPIVLREVHQVTLARTALARGRFDDVLSSCAQMLPGAEASGRMARVIEMSLLAAVALWQQGDEELAFDSLEKSLQLAQPERFQRIFLEAGPPFVQLLDAFCKSASNPGHLAQYAQGLLDTAAGKATTIEQPLLEPLSERELEVMGLIAAGHTNREIAQRLHVTLNTIKKHTSNIYGKLSVSSRTQAIAKMRALDLL